MAVELAIGFYIDIARHAADRLQLHGPQVGFPVSLGLGDTTLALR